MALGQCWYQFWLDDAGQDLVEYTIIIAVFVMLLFTLTGLLSPSIANIWHTGNSHLVAADSAAS
jgi:Flp pilus assembly pilin Flp